MNSDDAASAPKEDPVFDYAAAKAVLADDVELLREVLQAFLDTVPEQMDLLIAALQEKKYAEVEHRASEIKGAATSAHAARVRQKAAELEAAAHDGDSAAVEEQFRELAAELERFGDYLDDFNWDAGA
jgi:HPt (histidine-containing phosphotransfer) domain-containing protein